MSFERGLQKEDSKDSIMLLTHLVTAAMLALTPPTGSDGLTLRVSTAGLDLARPGDAAVLAERIVDESRRFCEANRHVVTPDHVGDPRVCQRAMADAAISALPRDDWRRFARAGGNRAVNRQL